MGNLHAGTFWPAESQYTGDYGIYAPAYVDDHIQANV